MKEICSFSLKEVKIWMEQNGEKPFRAAQLFDWIYMKDAASFEVMLNMGKELRAKLAAEFAFPVLKLLRTQESEDLETIKFLWELPMFASSCATFWARSAWPAPAAIGGGAAVTASETSSPALAALSFAESCAVSSC